MLELFVGSRTSRHTRGAYVEHGATTRFGTRGEISQVCSPQMTTACAGFPFLVQRGLACGQIAAATRIVMKIIILPGGKNASRMIMLALPSMSNTRPKRP